MEAFNAVTGRQLTVEDGLRIGKRILNQIRQYTSFVFLSSIVRPATMRRMMEDNAPAASRQFRLGEVVEASSTHFVAESYVLHRAPALGSFVRVVEGDLAIYAVTSDVRSGSVDPGRRPAARGHDEASEEDLYHNNPELRDLLRTEFSASVVGFADGVACRQHLPPHPARIHSFVYQCSPDEVRRFTARLDFLATLLAPGQRGTPDELIAACLRESAYIRDQRSEYLLRSGKELARLLPGQITRLNGILRRIKG